MARKGKIGIDYFSHDVDILQDKKIKLIKAKHGLVGYAIYLRLLEEIYRDTGYYLQLDEDFNILFSDDNKIEFNVYILILNDCIDIGLFNKKTYEKYNIITSKRIQLNYFSGTERRKEVEFIKEYLVLDPALTYNTEKVNVNIIPLNVDINRENGDIGTQRKGKESKVKKSKEKENSGNIIFPEWMPEELKRKVYDFTENRTAQKSPMTENAIKLFLTKIEKLSNCNPELAILMIDDAIINNWKSIYEPKTNKTKQQSDWRTAL